MRILICDDQARIRNGLTLQLALEPDMEVVGSAKDGAEAIAFTAIFSSDLILMDLKMPGLNGVETTRQICAQYPYIKVLVLTTYDNDSWLFEAIRAGAAGYLLKDSPREVIVTAIRGTMAGKTYVDPAVARHLLHQVTGSSHLPASLLTSKLSVREVAVLRLLACGLNNLTIAERLRLSEGTVRNHVSAILSKLHVEDRTQAALLALRHGLESV